MGKSSSRAYRGRRDAEIAALREENWRLKLAARDTQIAALKLIIRGLLHKAADARYLRGVLIKGDLVPGPGDE